MIDGEGGTGEGDGYGERGWRGGVCRGRERERVWGILYINLYLHIQTVLSWNGVSSNWTDITVTKEYTQCIH